MQDAPPDITGLLREWQSGDSRALGRLIPIVYGELHLLASRHLARERSNHALSTTALVNEAYVKLAGQRGATSPGRSHFYGIAAQCMRRVLVDQARGHARANAGGGVATVTLVDGGSPEAPALDPLDVVALDRALGQLEALDRQQGRIVELRYFAGLTVEETASVMCSSPAVVEREWAAARAWLSERIPGAPADRSAQA